MKNILLGIVAVAVVILISLAVVDRGVFGSTIDGQEYYSQYIGTTQSTSTSVSIKSGLGTLGSVVVASTTPFAFTLYDASSTQSTTTATKLMKFAASGQSNGTYQYDVSVKYGIKADLPANWDGLFVVTYK